MWLGIITGKIDCISRSSYAKLSSNVIKPDLRALFYCTIAHSTSAPLLIFISTLVVMKHGARVTVYNECSKTYSRANMKKCLKSVAIINYKCMRFAVCYSVYLDIYCRLLSRLCLLVSERLLKVLQSILLEKLWWILSQAHALHCLLHRW